VDLEDGCYSLEGWNSWHGRISPGFQGRTGEEHLPLQAEVVELEISYDAYNIYRFATTPDNEANMDLMG
jgi:hypothetical protein